ncbi:PKHD-type hydroxylase Sbal_3634 [Neisseria animaloris]|uniref:PKHD-type hydroxylase Sbal_3634 n=1 Tax=Neisseria animaloris TaxID=326522 RepID=A0A1X3CJK5_9NEIS|nr:Fe2+-dependent dioxygenase [Neisseria animaloris]MDO5074080.1 Fe2+-dependent dioxygenase [Neisseria animaloris]OSI07725.1 Fe2+-dependent dioxygenase [Neisseria animaloris]VEH88357.1 PKHD-type hydroxylase Sbal_3634 [Neisseria animaloris]VEJ21605.1 PKHD-type hydroxylase Sbal_3634 [Neisseria animaloris]
MLLHIENVLTADELAYAQNLLADAPWSDGKITAGSQSGQVKNNLQLPQMSETGKAMAELVKAAVLRNAEFFSAALPHTVFPPLVNCYREGQNFGNHIDNAIRSDPYTGQWVRTDVSTTLFLNNPDEYDGGELVIEDNYGSHRVKLAAGDMIVYPATSLHHVTPVTRGQRIASFFWTQSMVSSDEKRTMLFDMDRAITSLRAQYGESDESVLLTGVYHNLLRQWSSI